MQALIVIGLAFLHLGAALTGNLRSLIILNFA